MADPKLPLGPGLARWDPEEEEPGSRSETLSGRRSFRSRGYRRWRVSIAWPPLRRAQAAPIIAFLRGISEGDPFVIDPRPDGLGKLRCVLDGPQRPFSFRRNGLVRIELAVIEEPEA